MTPIPPPRHRRRARAARSAFGLAWIDVRTLVVAPEVLALVPAAEALRHRLLPLSQDGGVVRVAVADPLATEGLDALASRTGVRSEALLRRPSN